MENYSPEKTADIRVRRCAWIPPEADRKSDVLTADACAQLELAQCEIDRLNEVVQDKDCEIMRCKADAEAAWEIVAAHHFPEDYAVEEDEPTMEDVED